MSLKDKRRLTGYRTDTLLEPESVYDDYQHDDDVYEEYDEQDSDENHQQQEEEDTGSELSIPDENINFDLVYALHTFTATVEGQASVVRGDALTLLDDSNSYWWLVKVLKTAEVGYIPAENIETPQERLARLNSHRNIEITRKDNFDAFPIPPTTKPKNRKRVTLAKGVQYQSQFIYGSTSDDDSEDDFESEFQHWNENMCSSSDSDSQSSSEEEDSDDDSDDDPYHYYDEPQIIDPHQQQQQQQDQIVPTIESHLSADSDIINDPRDFMYYEEEQDESLEVESQQVESQQVEPKQAEPQHTEPQHTEPQHTEPQRVEPQRVEPQRVEPQRVEPQRVEPQRVELQKAQSRQVESQEELGSEDETIKISLTPSIARDIEEQHQNNYSDSQHKLKKAAKLEKLLNATEKKEKKASSGIRKFFSRSKKDKNTSTEQTERRFSNDSASITSTQSSMISRDRMGSVDSTQSATRLKIQPGSSGIKETFVDVYPSTTAAELIHQVFLSQPEQQNYQDYYLILKTSSGDECTLIPSDKPLEIFYSLTAHLNTPMPSLKKARRISQLMGSDNHVGGPASKEDVHDQVEFFLFSKTKRMEDGEFQIKVSLLPEDQLVKNERIDRLVKIPCSILIKDAVTLLLEKFHILNGVVADGDDVDEEAKRSLRLSDDNIAKYRLAIHIQAQEHFLPLNEKLLSVFGDNIPPIHYRRSSNNPDRRSSITTHIPPPEKNETYFILKCIERPKQEEKKKSHQTPRHLLVRQDTPMPRKEITPTDGFAPPITMDREILNQSPDTLINQIDDAIQDTLSTRKIRPASNESMLFCTNDFGMNDLMVIIRGMATTSEQNTTIRTEISHLFKDNQTRLDQLEKELDRIMLEAVQVYN
ncbi:hypothetical protein G6F38_011046 [Rhizopus arrhizus]|nr:hypothetical protein G6F38_011046 [Rhizopus arrhizus]